MDIAGLLREVTILSQYMSVIPVGVGLYCWSYLNRALRLFWLNVLCMLLIAVTNEYLIARQIENTPMVYVNILCDSVLLTAFFTTYMAQQRVRWIFVGLCLGLVLLVGWSLWQWTHALDTALRLSSLETGLVLIMAVLTMRALFRQTESGSLRQQPAVYLTGGVLAASSLTLVLTVFSEALYTYSVPAFTLFWNTLSPLSSLLFYIFTCIGFWRSRFWGVQSG